MKIHRRTLLKKSTPDSDHFPFGIRFYDGVQGAGKTLSMVFDTANLLLQYPDTQIISNVLFNNISFSKLMFVLSRRTITPPLQNRFHYFTTIDELITLITENEQSNVKHTIIILDEGLTYFAENGGIDPSFMSIITQNRKNRRLIMISTQKFTRINNRIRDFSTESVICKGIGKFQYNVIRDDTTLSWDKESMDYVGIKKGSYIFKKIDVLYNSYDTYQNIKNAKNKTTAFYSAKAPPVLADQKSGGLLSFKRKV